MTEFALKREIPVERILLHELIHRINNEFASVIGAVSRAAARSRNQEVKVTLARIIEQLSNYAAVHHALQMPDHDKYIDAAAYLDDLCLSIGRSKLDGLKIDLLVAASPLRLPSMQCWRLGMIVFELITNSARHAFGNGSGQVRVEYRAFAKLLNAWSQTMAQLRRMFGGDAGSQSSTNWSRGSMDALTRSLDTRARFRY